MPLILYQRDDCHLCDAAITVLAQARAGDFASVFIDDQPELEARYGLRVPVLADAAGRELDWPFDATRVRGWLREALAVPAPGSQGPGNKKAADPTR